MKTKITIKINDADLDAILRCADHSENKADKIFLENLQVSMKIAYEDSGESKRKLDDNINMLHPIDQMLYRRVLVIDECTKSILSGLASKIETK